MARMRSLKPEFWTDRKLARSTSRDARLLYLGMWNLADEHARLRGDAAYLRGQILPYDDVTLEQVDGWVDELAANGRLTRYTADDEIYLHIPTLPKHQRLEAAKVPSRLPEPPAQIGANKSAPRADSPGPNDGESASPQVSDSAQIGANKSVPIVALHVAGGMEQVAGSRLQGSEKTSEGTVDLVDAGDRDEPSPTCIQHKGMTNPPACGGCAAAREHHDRVTARRDAEAKSTAARQAAEDRRAEIDRCDLCGPDGYRLDKPTTICPHDIAAIETAARGVAALRAAAGGAS